MRKKDSYARWSDGGFWTGGERFRSMVLDMSAFQKEGTITSKRG